MKNRVADSVIVFAWARKKEEQRGVVVGCGWGSEREDGLG